MAAGAGTAPNNPRRGAVVESMPTERWKVGDVTITKIVELEFWAPLDFLAQLLPSSTRGEVETLDWLSPDYLRDGQFHIGVFSFLIDTPSRKLVVDTGVGNSKSRTSETWNMLNTDYLTKFEDVWDPADVEGIICTHLHVDHVGWNTHLVDGQWVPTFSNATHFMIKSEHDYWKRLADNHDGVDPFLDAAAVFDDSVRPIVDAGLAKFVEPDAAVTPEVTLIPSPGHTPGHISVLVESKGESAVITGDLMHMPCQIGHPEWSSAYDTDQVAAVATRRKFLERFADTQTTVIGTHFGTPTGCRVERAGAGFGLSPIVCP
jgi:glyoxylase-like metal-dependent hydrolase (beta-lactamase superfamily II)